MVLGRKAPPQQAGGAEGGAAAETNAGARKPNAAAPVPGAAPMAAADLLYAKATFQGYAGKKEIIFVPDSIKWTTKLVDQMLDAIGMQRPNLVLDVRAPCCPQLNMLNEDELQCPEIQELCEQDAAVGDRNRVIREVLALKMKGLVSAVMSSLDQTKSCALFEAAHTNIAQAVGAINNTTGVNSKILCSFHICKQTLITGGEMHKLFSGLLSAAVPMNEASVAAAQPVSLDFHWHQEAMCADNSAWTHFVVDGNGQMLPEDKRHPGSQFWGDADLYFVGYRRNQEGEMDFDCGFVDNPQFSAALLAPAGRILFGGRPPNSQQVLECFEGGVPLVLVNHTGGFSSVWAEIVLAIVQVINDTPGWQAKFAKSAQSKQGAKVMDGSVASRILAVSASKLLEHAFAATCTSKEKSCVSLSEVSHCLDIAQTRHQLFSETVRVLDPLIHTPEQALEVLSACFSSTYVGLQELGATTALQDVVVKAWNVHRMMEAKADQMRFWDLTLAYLGAVLAWIAIMSASSLDVGRSCGADDTDVGELRFCNILGRKITQKWLELLTIVVPAGGALIVTMAARFQFRLKWGSAKLAAAQIVRHIYLFRGSVDLYNNSKQSEDEDEEISQSAVAKMARLKFVAKISGIQSKVLALDSMDMDRSVMLSSYEIPAHIRQSLYGLKPDSGKFGKAALIRPESEGLLEEGASSSTSLDEDDGLSATTAEFYHQHRILQLLAFYGAMIPGLSKKSDMLRLVIFFLGFLASMLGATHNSSWIPTVVGLASMLEVLMVVHNMVVRSGVMNAAISALDNLDMQWNGLSNMDRRTPKFKEFIMSQAEQLALSVVEAWAGQLSATADKMDQDGKEATQSKDSGGKAGGKAGSKGDKEKKSA